MLGPSDTKIDKMWFLSSKNLLLQRENWKRKERNNPNKAINNSYRKSKYYLVQF